ncbi:hypothetical protein FGL68_21105 [Acinetobacter baumannii]|nr:hypothetical protein [Acinetobacter baumannii]
MDNIKNISKKYKSAITIGLVFILGFSSGYVLKGMTTPNEVDSVAVNKEVEPKKDTNNNEDVFSEDNETDKKEEKKDEQNTEDKGAKLSTKVEEGFKTTIVSGSSDEEIIKNNNFITDSKISIQDRLEAKRVAENFVQAITAFDISDVEGTAKRPVKYVSKDKVKEIEGLYLFLGKSKEIKKSIVDEVYTTEKENKDGNDYIYFRVTVEWHCIDKNDQKISGGDESYMCQLLKEDGVYKVFQYHVD